jgi:hypothetical protein
VRLRSDIWVASLIRRAQAEGAYVAVARKGAAEAGAIFIVVDRRDGTLDLLAPAPQAALVDLPGDRLFQRLLRATDSPAVEARIAQELRFDSDLWVVEIEDRAGRAFVEVVA